MARSCPRRHRPTLVRVARVRGAHDFIGVPRVPFVRLDPLAWVEEVAQNFIKNCNVRELTRGVRALDPHQVPPQDAHAQLVAEGGLPGVFVGPERVTLNCGSLLLDQEVRPIDCDQTVV